MRTWKRVLAAGFLPGQMFGDYYEYHSSDGYRVVKRGRKWLRYSPGATGIAVVCASLRSAKESLS